MTTLVPSHAEPIGHSLQAVRSVVFVPPEVNQPAPHTAQLAAWFALHRLSAPQASHTATCPAENVPARHGAHDDAPLAALVPAPHACCSLVPSHAKPGGQGAQFVRVVIPSPPVVHEPAGHALQLLAPASLYRLSLPHSEQLLAPAAAAYPASHCSMMLVPLHSFPARQAVQAVRVVFVPPEVNQPARQIEQFSALLSLHALSAPHSVHASDATSDHVPARHGEHSGEPLPAYVPASQRVWFWPSHANPAGHVVHVPFAFGTVPA